MPHQTETQKTGKMRKRGIKWRFGNQKEPDQNKQLIRGHQQTSPGRGKGDQTKKTEGGRVRAETRRGRKSQKQQREGKGRQCYQKHKGQDSTGK